MTNEPAQFQWPHGLPGSSQHTQHEMNAFPSAIRIGRLQSGEIETLLNLYVDLFHDREPLTRCIGLSRERMQEFARAMYSTDESDSRTQRLAWLARADIAGNDAAGFILCDDPAAEGSEPALPDNLTEHEREQVSFLLTLMESVRKPKQAQIQSHAGKCLHIAAIGVASGYEGTGIATRLLQTALADAVAQGFTCAFAECTSNASRRCHEKSGFRCLHSVDMSAFTTKSMRLESGTELELHLLWKELSDTN